MARLFVSVLEAFKSLGKSVWCYHSNETSLVNCYFFFLNILQKEILIHHTTCNILVTKGLFLLIRFSFTQHLSPSLHQALVEWKKEVALCFRTALVMQQNMSGQGWL